jgi:hypothetical protein
LPRPTIRSPTISPSKGSARAAWPRPAGVWGRLYQACGLRPAPGEPIEPADLFNARLVVEIAADLYNGERRLKAVGYRHADQPPF